MINDYTTLSLAEVRAGIDDIARDAQATFGGFDAQQLNWKADAKQWSVAQCFDHLLIGNGLMRRATDEALEESGRRSLWQRLPLLPAFFGRMLIRSQTPGAARKFTAPAVARPAASDIAPDVIQRFVAQHHELAGWVQTLDESRAARTIMTSPFASFITYSVLDGCRLTLAHDRRHVEQARRVTQSPQFPRS